LRPQACRSVDGRAHRGRRLSKARLVAWPRCRLIRVPGTAGQAVRNPESYVRLISWTRRGEPRAPIPKAGCMCTGFWHTVQFSRSEMRSVRVPPAAASGTWALRRRSAFGLPSRGACRPRWRSTCSPAPPGRAILGGGGLIRLPATPSQFNQGSTRVHRGRGSRRPRTIVEPETLEPRPTGSG
jgi:hypothetical protein